MLVCSLNELQKYNNICLLCENRGLARENNQPLQIIELW